MIVVSLSFSTHITSVLDKCADFITFINNGEMIESQSMDDLIATYRVVKGKREQLGFLESTLIAYETHASGFSGLIKTKDLRASDLLEVEPTKLEGISVNVMAGGYRDNKYYKKA